MSIITVYSIHIGIVIYKRSWRASQGTYIPSNYSIHSFFR